MSTESTNGGFSPKGDFTIVGTSAADIGELPGHFRTSLRNLGSAGLEIANAVMTCEKSGGFECDVRFQRRTLEGRVWYTYEDPFRPSRYASEVATYEEDVVEVGTGIPQESEPPEPYTRYIDSNGVLKIRYPYNFVGDNSVKIWEICDHFDISPGELIYSGLLVAFMHAKYERQDGKKYTTAVTNGDKVWAIKRDPHHRLRGKY